MAAVMETIEYTPTAPVVPKHKKLSGYDLYNAVGAPKYVVAPMVDQSELAWRLLSKAPFDTDVAGEPETITGSTGNKYARYPGGCHLSYTPMIHARVFTDSKPSGRGGDSQFDLTKKEEGSAEVLAGIEGGDRPLFVQFCANDPDVLLAAAKKVEGRCDAVDINFGCPQGIARKGHYGSFLQDEWELVYKLISTLHENLKVPVTAKFRIFPEVDKTVRYAKMMEAAGAQILTCHGRTRDMKGQFTGLADWEQIKAVKAAVKVPVFANGNILYREDVDRCLEVTGADGVMSAEGNLSNPALFADATGEHAYASSIALARRYLDIVSQLKTNTTGSAVKSHMFRLLRPILDQFEEARELIGKTGFGPNQEARIAHYRETIDKFAEMAQTTGWDGRASIPAPTPLDETTGYRKLPVWAAQPYIRPTPVSSEVGGVSEFEGGVAASDNDGAGASAGPSSRAMSPSGGERVDLRKTIVLDMCAGSTCKDNAASRCPTRACLVHCRELRAVAAGMDRAEAAREAANGRLVGQGCESHESKAAQRTKRRKEVYAWRDQNRRDKKRKHAEWKAGQRGASAERKAKKAGLAEEAAANNGEASASVAAAEVAN